jgi:16S rRNA (guanine966-N2)-methyltransferase
MRIVAGAFGGRRLHAPRDLKIRPTPDRVREAVFSIIASHLPGATVLDLFAGTGAMGLEALSRGAERAVFVDEDPGAIRLVRANTTLCGAAERAVIVQAPVERALKRLSAAGDRFHVIFMDPPYGKGFIERTLPHLIDVAHPGALVVAEHHVKDVLPDLVGQWMKSRERRYGDTEISFYVMDLPC